MASSPVDHSERETTRLFQPNYDSKGLIPAIVTDNATGGVVMFAWMNEEALQRTLESGLAHYWSRSRKALWQKGEKSGNVQQVREIRVDCDQDCLWLKVDTAGDGVNCHTGAVSCFYRRVAGTGGALALVFDNDR